MQVITENNIHYHGIALQCNPDIDRSQHEPYFKCEFNFKGKNKIARICFIEPDYVQHYNATGDDLLDSKTRSILVEALPSIVKGYNYTYWLFLIRTFNRRMSEYPEYILSEDLPIPDYRKLKVAKR